MGVKLNARKNLELSTQPLVFRIDDTLTKEGYGADSKAVGEAIEELKNNSGGVQADWEASSESPSYVKNRTHFEAASTPFFCDLVENPEVGITLLVDLSGTHATPINNNLGYSNLNNPDYYYLVRIPHLTIYKKNGKEIPVNFQLTSQSSAILIDTKNYYIKPMAKGNYKIFVIVDNTVLTDEYKALFPNKGVYLEVLEFDDATMTHELKNLEFKVCCFQQINRRYIPNSIARQDALTALEKRVAALEAAAK